MNQTLTSINLIARHGHGGAPATRNSSPRSGTGPVRQRPDDAAGVHLVAEFHHRWGRSAAPVCSRPVPRPAARFTVRAAAGGADRLGHGDHRGLVRSCSQDNFSNGAQQLDEITSGPYDYYLWSITTARPAWKWTTTVTTSAGSWPASPTWTNYSLPGHAEHGSVLEPASASLLARVQDN